LTLFVIALLSLIFVFANFPPLKPEHKVQIKMPHDIEDVKNLAVIIEEYKNDYFYTVTLGFSLTYIFLQAFSIPGSIFLSFLAGTLYGLPGVLLVCFISSVGASCAFGVSYFIGLRLLKKFAPSKLRYFGEQIQQHRHNLFNYFLFLRISPFLPNWFINLASPAFSVPFKTFWWGTFIGIAPQTFIAVKAGITIQDIAHPSDVFHLKSIIILFILATLSLLPTLKPVQLFLEKVMNKSSDKTPFPQTSFEKQEKITKKNAVSEDL